MREYLPQGEIKLKNSNALNARAKAACERLQQLGVDVIGREFNCGYDYEIRMRVDRKYPLTVLVEIGYVMAQLTDHQFPEEFNGFGSGSGAVPYWAPKVNYSDEETGIRVDVDPLYIYFRFDLYK